MKTKWIKDLDSFLDIPPFPKNDRLWNSDCGNYRIRKIMDWGYYEIYYKDHDERLEDENGDDSWYSITDAKKVVEKHKKEHKGE